MRHEKCPRCFPPGPGRLCVAHKLPPLEMYGRSTDSKMASEDRMKGFHARGGIMFGTPGEFATAGKWWWEVQAEGMMPPHLVLVSKHSWSAEEIVELQRQLSKPGFFLVLEPHHDARWVR